MDFVAIRRLWWREGRSRVLCGELGGSASFQGRARGPWLCLELQTPGPVPRHAGGCLIPALSSPPEEAPYLCPRPPPPRSSF